MACVQRLELRSDAEDRVDELALRYSIALGDPADLTFVDGMHRLIAFDGSTSALDRSESEACGNPLLDEAMVLLDDIVQIWCRSASAATTELACLLQLGDRASVRRMPVHVDYSRARA